MLVCDSFFAVAGSFNWLSFRGDRGRAFRDQRSWYIGIPEKVEEVWREHEPLFSA